jgi:hypothetical protein
LTRSSAATWIAPDFIDVVMRADLYRTIAGIGDGQRHRWAPGVDFDLRPAAKISLGIISPHPDFSSGSREKLREKSSAVG